MMTDVMMEDSPCRPGRRVMKGEAAEVVTTDMLERNRFGKGLE